MYKNFIFITILFMAFSLPKLVLAQNNAPLELAPNKPSPHKWSSGEQQTYSMALTAGQYIELSYKVAKGTDDIAQYLKVFQPDGMLIVQSNNFISFTATITGNYRLEMKAFMVDPEEQAKTSNYNYTLQLTTGSLEGFKPSYPLVSKHTFKDYEARFYGDKNQGSFEVLQNGARIYAQKGGRFWLGDEEFNEAPAQPNNLVAMGQEITNLGQPNLLVQEDTGEDGYRSIYVYELAKNLPHVATIYVGEYPSVSFADLDGDKRPELIVSDDTFAEWQVDEVEPPIPEVVLKFRDGAYHLAPEFMHHPAPDLEELQQQAQEAHDADWEEGLLETAPWSSMVYLIYSGHAGLAWTFFESAWPLDEPGNEAAKKEFLRDFQQQLTTSPYWAELKTLSPLSRPNVKVGYIDKTGKTVISPAFTTISQFQEDLAPVLIEGRYGYIDNTGKVVIKPQFVSASNFADGLAAISVESKENILYGYIDKTGKIIIKPQFVDASDFAEGLAAIAVEDKTGVAYGYIDKTGKIVIKPQFDEANDFSEGLASVSLEIDEDVTAYGYIDKTGKIVIKPQFDEASSFSAGLACIGVVNQDEESSYGYIDKTGKIVIKSQFDEAEDFAQGLALVTVADKYGFIDPTGKITIANQFDAAESFSEELALIELNGKYGFIDTKGQIVIKPQFDEARPFANGLALVRVQGKYGYINSTGEIVIKPQFDEALDFVNGLAAIIVN